MMNNPHTALSKFVDQFTPISLSEMDGVSLMDRTDVKFIVSSCKLESILQELSDRYQVLTINGLNIFSYRTDYFDTPGMDMFFDHHNGKLNRFKIRQREYVESNLRFLEVKFKSNKGRVTKDRIISDHHNQESFYGFINKYTPYDPQNLNLTLVNRFNRLTLVDKDLSERVTIDFNLSFSNKVHQVRLKGLVIIEIKQNRTNYQSAAYSVLKSHALRPASISKYCIGISMLNKNTKFNNFKKTILMIKKISHVELSA